MQEVILGILIGIVFLIFISPYFSLWNLKDLDKLDDIRTELEGIKKELRKLNEWKDTEAKK